MGRAAGDRTRRVRIAAEAARLIAADGGGLDYLGARRKALRRLGIGDAHDLPGEAEIAAALAEHHRIFGGPGTEDHLHAQRVAALEAMQFLAAHEPRLVDEVLEGTAGPHTPIRILLHVDDELAVLDALAARGLRWDESRRPYALAGGLDHDATVLALCAGGMPFELVLLPSIAQRHPPLRAADRTPLERAGIEAVRRLLGPA
jgi:hypothetical protein